MQLAPLLLDWWDRHGRHDLPWQKSPTPYRVWVSEIMLQQTQVATVLRYYDSFMQAFPDVQALAAAPADAVLHRWSGLGYYARARNLHRAARLVCERHGGVVPAAFDALSALPGIGRSTAGAILALSAGQRHAILDGNVKRVLARVFCIDGQPSASAVQRQLWALAEDCTPTQRVAHYTQAIMDLGASVCTRRKPACALCPLREACLAHAGGLTEQLPARKPARVRPLRHCVLLLCARADGAVLLERRAETGIWGGLWGLPEISSVEAAGEWCSAQLGTAPGLRRVRPVLRHGFTHFDLDITPVECHLAAVPLRAMESDRWLWYNKAVPAEIGLAAPVTRLIDSLL
ncbi:MAG: A/G-specific adenine glycosylase [Gammaproteobacteria bacterium]|nr:A/G-specific adenine glycosylase [Gammaproteobacteria bacterium]